MAQVGGLRKVCNGLAGTANLAASLENRERIEAMVFGLGLLSKRRNERMERVRAVYDLLVAQARHPVFYTDYNVPDTLTGRFDMIVLHAFLFFERLKEEDAQARAFGQDVFDAFIDDMDGSLREMGVGYQAVPKRMKKMGEAFYGRIAAYDKAITSGDKAALTDSLERNIFADVSTDLAPNLAKPAALADYVLHSVHLLHQIPVSALYMAKIAFPDPSEFLPKKDQSNSHEGAPDER